jgi:hypothetical protein
MKKHLMVVPMLALFIVTLAVTSAHAQSPSSLRVNIPFSFVAGGQVLPPGRYRISPVINDGNINGAMRILNLDKPRGENFNQLSLTRIASAKRDGKLIFHQYGDEYFLASFWTPGQKNGNGLRVTRAERACMARMPKQEVVVAIK